jgi:hypothetical protein
MSVGPYTDVDGERLNAGFPAGLLHLALVRALTGRQDTTKPQIERKRNMACEVSLSVGVEGSVLGRPCAHRTWDNARRKGRLRLLFARCGHLRLRVRPCKALGCHKSRTTDAEPGLIDRAASYRQRRGDLHRHFESPGLSASAALEL